MRKERMGSAYDKYNIYVVICYTFTFNGERDDKLMGQFEYSVYVRSNIIGPFEVRLYMSESTLFEIFI